MVLLRLRLAKMTAVATVLLTVSSLQAAESTKLAAERLVAEKVRLLLSEKCLACHGGKPDDIKSAFDLRTRESALRGGESGEPAIVPGDPESSRLYKAVRWDGLEMPPKKNDRLTSRQIEILRQWIADGAPWFESTAVIDGAASGDVSRIASVGDDWSSADGVAVKTSGGLSPEWTNRRYKLENLWAYQPIARPDVPKSETDEGRTQNPIDAFIHARLMKAGISNLAPAADDRTFIRRATFDLLGLPPTPTEVEAFLSDRSPERLDKLIERLLADPRYGEQQARHWLDVVRYADTSGFSNDVERPNSWRYRDYVIRSFNADKRFDRFITEQLAGDELDPADPEMLIAVGFLRMGPWEHTAMTVAAVTRQQFLDDVTHHVGVSLLGQGLRCASCHDHKFDPIPTRDYYRMQAIYAPIQFVERPAPFLASENVTAFDVARKRVEARLAEVNKRLRALGDKAAAAKADYLRQRNVSKLEDLPPEERPPGGNFGREFGLTRQEQSLQKIYDKSHMYLERELARFEPRALSVYNGAANGYSSVKPLYAVPKKRSVDVPSVHILAGGALESPLDVVTPGFLTAVAGSNDVEHPTNWNTAPHTVTERRLALARWIASPQNTLTARVIANRIWQQHFGSGLVATPNNFGSMGAKPTHPELLDWLATWLIDHDWSLKQLHQLIMRSATYGRAGESPDRDLIDKVDPANALLAYFPSRRLSAEEIRDSMLMISGELNLEMGGPGVFPEIHWEVALQPRHIMGSVAPAYLPSPTPRERNRRTIYAFRYRTLSDPLLEVLNRPGCDISCEQRDRTTVAPQALSLLNGDFVQHRSLALAAALTRERSAFDDQLDAVYRRAYGRSPVSDEVETCRQYYAQALEFHRANVPLRIELPKRVKRGMIEEFTGEMVYWDEELPLDDYIRDTMPWDVTAEVRALSDVCVVLLNSNEFLYVR